MALWFINLLARWFLRKPEYQDIPTLVQDIEYFRTEVSLAKLSGKSYIGLSPEWLLALIEEYLRMKADYDAQQINLSYYEAIAEATVRKVHEVDLEARKAALKTYASGEYLCRKTKVRLKKVSDNKTYLKLITVRRPS